MSEWWVMNRILWQWMKYYIIKQIMITEAKRKLYTANQKKARYIKRQLEIRAYIWQKKKEIQLQKESLENNI